MHSCRRRSAVRRRLVQSGRVSLRSGLSGRLWRAGLGRPPSIAPPVAVGRHPCWLNVAHRVSSYSVANDKKDANNTHLYLCSTQRCSNFRERKRERERARSRKQ
ncbi:unnamed protein product, partial [Ectocarpus sp. 13 AM-2016]